MLMVSFGLFIAIKMYKVLVIIHVKMLEKAYLTVNSIKTFLLQPAGPYTFELKQEKTGLSRLSSYLFLH